MRSGRSCGISHVSFRVNGAGPLQALLLLRLLWIVGSDPDPKRALWSDGFLQMQRLPRHAQSAFTSSSKPCRTTSASYVPYGPTAPRSGGRAW